MGDGGGGRGGDGGGMWDEWRQRCGHGQGVDGFCGAVSYEEARRHDHLPGSFVERLPDRSYNVKVCEPSGARDPVSWTDKVVSAVESRHSEGGCFGTEGCRCGSLGAG